MGLKQINYFHVFQIINGNRYGSMEYDRKQLCRHQILDRYSASVYLEQEIFSFKDLPYKFIECSSLREIDEKNYCIWKHHFKAPSLEKDAYHGI